MNIGFTLCTVRVRRIDGIHTSNSAHVRQSLLSFPSRLCSFPPSSDHGQRFRLTSPRSVHAGIMININCISQINTVGRMGYIGEHELEIPIERVGRERINLYRRTSKFDTLVFGYVPAYGYQPLMLFRSTELN
jgi:hypothetical protein